MIDKIKCCIASNHCDIANILKQTYLERGLAEVINQADVKMANKV